MSFVKEGFCKKFLGLNVCRLLLRPVGFVWFSLIVLSCGFPSKAQSQQAPIFQASGAGMEASQQQPDQQVPGSISGAVVDGSGAVVVGAHVTLTRAEQASPREALSGDDGQFSFANVAPATFQLKIMATGFAPQTVSGTLHSGEVYITPSNPLVPELDTAVQVGVTRVEVAEDQIKVQEKQRVLGF